MNLDEMIVGAAHEQNYRRDVRFELPLGEHERNQLRAAAKRANFLLPGSMTPAAPPNWQKSASPASHNLPRYGEDVMPGVQFQGAVSGTLWYVLYGGRGVYHTADIFRLSGDELTQLAARIGNIPVEHIRLNRQDDNLLRMELMEYELWKAQFSQQVTIVNLPAKYNVEVKGTIRADDSPPADAPALPGLLPARCECGSAAIGGGGHSDWCPAR